MNLLFGVLESFLGLPRHSVLKTVRIILLFRCDAFDCIVCWLREAFGTWPCRDVFYLKYYVHIHKNNHWQGASNQKADKAVKDGYHLCLLTSCNTECHCYS